MSATSATVSRLTERGGGLRLDFLTIALTLAILLLGLVMVSSASISMAAHEPGGDPFSYLEKQLILTLAGMMLAALIFLIPTDWLERYSLALLVIAGLLLLAVLIPGLGHVVNGSRRWIRLPGVNFQASEGARVLVLVYLASYCVRREAELRETLTGLLKPLGLLLVLSVALTEKMIL